MAFAARPLRLVLDAETGLGVAALAITPPATRAVYVLAHGAGAGMEHPFMAAVAEGLATRGVATLRYQFPSMERGSKRPDPPAAAHAAVRAAVSQAAHEWPGLPLLAGGKSFGGRMTSQAQAERPLPGVRGLVFLGFPLHPPKRPAVDRAAHLAAVKVPMLFLQGDRDALANLNLLEPVIAGLGARATLHVCAGADHGFNAARRSGLDDAGVLTQLLDAMTVWLMDRLAAPGV